MLVIAGLWALTLVLGAVNAIFRDSRRGVAILEAEGVIDDQHTN